MILSEQEISSTKTRLQASTEHRTHHATCWTYHDACLALRLLAIIEELQEERAHAPEPKP